MGNNQSGSDLIIPANQHQGCSEEEEKGGDGGKDGLGERDRDRKHMLMGGAKLRFARGRRRSKRIDWDCGQETGGNF